MENGPFSSIMMTGNDLPNFKMVISTLQTVRLPKGIWCFSLQMEDPHVTMGLMFEMVHLDDLGIPYDLGNHIYISYILYI